MQHDAWFFIGIFVFIFIVWIATGGPLHPIAFSGPTLRQPEELGGGTYLQFPRAAGTIGTSKTCLPGSSCSQSGSQSGSSGNQRPAPTTGGSVFGIPSDYQRLVTMRHYVSSASSSDPKNEYVEIALAHNASASVNITGWALVSEATDNAELIPKGTRVPSSGVVNAADDIILEPGERAIIISGESPVGASFRENKCIGYFSSFQKFSPSLPQNCPSPSSELSALYGPYIRDPSCIDYVATLPRCKVAVAQTTKITRTCQDFLESHFNYNGCVLYHKSDSDFNGDTWRIYLGRTKHMWRARHEIVKLLDKRGKTVDMFSY